MEFCLKLFALLLLAALGSSQNLTLQDAASGSEVTLLSIGSVHQSGVFGDDKEMLRRIAYTETRDGTKSNTYRSGYHGGIWAVDEDNFLKTKNTTRYTRLPARFQQIRLHFGIDWQTVQWRELRKPLFSALAARLVLYIAPATIPSADNLTAQGEFWVAHYNSGGDASTFETTSSGLQGTILESAGNEFFLGFSINYQANYFDNLQLFVSTPELSPTTFSVTASGYSYTGTATNRSTTIVTLPRNLEVTSSTQRNKGIRVKGQGQRKLVVYGISYETYTTDAFLALPCTSLAVDTYEYYGITYATRDVSDILLVGCEDQTVVTTPAGTFNLNRQETYLITRNDITGYKVTSNKPLSFFSNHRCPFVPSGDCCCDFITEQIPPTFTWGREFFAASLRGRSSGEYFKIIASKDSTVVRVKCTSLSQNLVYNLATAGSNQAFQISSNNFCSIESNSPILVMQFATANARDGVGDPFMMMIPPVEQYSNNYVLNVLSSFSTNYITIYVASRYYQPNRIFVDNVSQQSATWTPVRCVNNSICGYINRVSLVAGEHSLSHQDPEARVGVSAYGFNNYNSYGYSGGLKLTPIQLATVSFIDESYYVTEREGPIQVNVTRSGNLQNTSVVLVATDNFRGSASVREDYTSISQILEFLPGETEKQITVQINDDTKVEDNETFYIYLIPGSGVTLTPIDRTEVTIGNDDGMITLNPSYGSMLGGTGVVATGEGLLVSENDDIVCMFDNVSVRGIFINSRKVLCVSPLLQNTGDVNFKLNISGMNGGESIFKSLSYAKSYGVHLENDDLLFTNETNVRVRWSPFSIFSLELSYTFKVDITLLELNLTAETWSEVLLVGNISNTGYTSVSIPRLDETTSIDEIISPIVIKVTLSLGSSNSRLLSSLSQFNLKTSQHSPIRYLRKNSLLVMQGLCTSWSSQQPTRIGQDILNILPPCPLRQRDVVAINSGYALEMFTSVSPISGDIPARVGNWVCDLITSNSSNIVTDDKHKKYFHPNIADCYRLRRTDLGGHSQQCCYGNNGFLVTGPPGGGNVDRVAPDLRLLSHFINDIIPYLLCCKAGQFSKCTIYYEKRPSDRGFDFSPPRPPARARTDPHMVTFDGHQYTFNGKGEYWLVVTSDDRLTLQGRMLPITTAQNMLSQATVYKAIVAKQNDSDTVQFEIIEGCSFVALVNGQQVVFGLINQQEFKNVVVSYLGNNTLSASFSSGVYIEAKEEVGMISVVSVSLPDSYQDIGTQGLMGSFNQNVTDDLLPNSGDEPLSLNSSTRKVHEQFGITWIIDSPVDSLFTYQPGETWATFYEPYFVPIYQPVFSDSTLQQQATEVCGTDLECLFDMAATGRRDIGQVSVEVEQEIEETLELQVPVVCPSSCGFGVCTGNNTCQCEAGYAGTNCSTPVISACDENPCQFGGTCSRRGVQNICNCPPATSGDFCEIDLDIDECLLEQDQCHPVASCTNTRGSYSCTCPPGSSGNGFNCTDLCNECTGLPSNCGAHNCNTTTSDCTNTIGGFQCSCRFGSDGGICAPPPRPDSPTSLNVLSVGTTTISISWSEPTAANNISTYTLMLTEIRANIQTTVSVTSGTNSYNFTGLQEYRNYSFTLTATSIYGAVSNSTTSVSAFTLEAAPSASPENFSAVSDSPTSAAISWEPPPTDEINGEIIHYIINVTVVGSGRTFLLYSTTTSLNVSNLLPFTTYVCIIAAVTSAGVGPFGSQIVLQTPQSAPVSPPENVALSPVSSTSINITWLPPPSQDINGIITEYRVTVIEVLTGRRFNFTSTSSFVVVFGLHPHYAYECVVSAYTVGIGPYSQAISITTPESVPSDSPVSFGGNTTSSRSAFLSWDPPPPDQQNGIIIYYIINVTVQETGQRFQLNSTDTYLSVNNLQPYRNYICVIAAATSVGIGPFSLSFTLVTPQDVPTQPPRNPTANATSSRSIACSWDPPPYEHQNGRIIQYRVNLTEVITGRVLQYVSISTSLVVDSLHPDYIYEWTVTAVTIGVGPYTVTSRIRTPEDVPSASPQALAISNVTTDSVELIWQPPALPDQNGVIIGYLINITSLDSGVIQQLTSSSPSLLIMNLQPFTRYSCVIAARTAVGLGPFSTVVSVQTMEAAPGSHPSNLTGTSLNSTHLYLTWDTPPPSLINGIIREYRVNITEESTGYVFHYTTNPSIREVIVGSLHPYTIYHCSVVAITVEQGPYTSVFTIQTDEDVPSGPPTNFVTTSVDSRTINLTWSPPRQQEQNGILRYYVVLIQSEFSVDRRNVSSSQLSIAVTGLQPYTVYNCSVSVGTIGLGPFSLIKQIRTPEDVPNGPPQNFTVAVDSSRSLTLNWSPPLLLDANGIIVDYTITVISNSGNSSFQIGSSTTSYTLTSLRPYVRYTCLVAAHTVIGRGPFSSQFTITTPEETPEAGPVDITHSNVMPQSVRISWNPPNREHQNGIIRHYQIEAYENATGNVLTYQTPSDGTSFLITNLHPFYVYTVRIQAVTIGPGPLSESLTVTTAEDIPTAAPLSPSGSPLNSTFISIVWNPPPAEHINGIIDLYILEVTEVVTNFTWLFYAADTHINAGPLHPFYLYRCRISASTIGQGPFTGFFYVTSGEAVPTDAPSNLLTTGTTTTSLSLSWDPPPSEHQNGVIRYYIVYIVDVTNQTSWDITVNGTEVTITGLNPFFTYNCSVAAYTVATGPTSFSVVATLPQSAPSVPVSNVRGFAPDHSSIILEWDPPPTLLTNGIITAYIIKVIERETGLRFEHNTTTTSITLDSLHPHYIYECRIAARTVETGPFSTVFAVQVLMAAPSGTAQNITVDAASSTSIELLWEPPLPHDRNGPIIGYSVTVQEQHSGYHVASLLISNDTSVIVTSLRPYTTYSFTVSARNSIGYGPSFIVHQTTLEDTPSAPVNVSVIAISGDPYSIMVSWDLPTSPNGRITNYTVYCQEAQVEIGSGDPSLIFPTMPLNTVFTNSAMGSNQNAIITGLTPFTNYSCYTTATTMIGEGSTSSLVNATTDEYIPFDSPVVTQVRYVSPSAVSLTWSLPVVPYGIIVSYSLLVEESVGGNVTAVVVNSTFGTNFAVTNLSPFTSYNISIAASTRIGKGPFSTISIKTLQDRPSGFPLSITSSVSGPTTANVSWIPPSPELRHGIILYYTVLLTDTTFGLTQELYNTTVTAINFTDLEEYVRYSCEVSAATIAGLGPSSSPVEFTTLEDVPSAPPQNFNGSTLSSSVIMLMWSPPPMIDKNGDIEHYVVNVVERYTGRQWTFVVVGLFLHVGGLHPHYYYDCNVSAYTIGSGPYSSTYSILTAPEAPIAAPQQVLVTKTSTSITLSWSPPPYEDTNGDIQYYTLMIVEVDTNTTLPPILSYTTEFTVSNLHPHYIYQCSVAAYTTENGPFSPPVTIQLLQDAPSTPPLELGGYASSSDTIDVSWSLPILSGRNGVIQHYIVNVTELNTGTTSSHVVSRTNFTLFSLHPHYTYSVTVSAVTIAAGPPSDPIIITTDSEAPSQPPVNINVPIIASSEVTLMWEPPNEADRNGIIIGYLVSVTDVSTGSTFTRNATSTTIVLSSLKPFIHYDCLIAARTEVGLGPFSMTVSFSTEQAAPSAPPENVTLAATRPTSIQVTWSPPDVDYHNGIITVYQINLQEVDTEMERNYSSYSTSTVIQSLHPYYTYQIQVSALTVAAGPYSVIQVLQMPEDVPSGFPQSFMDRVDSSHSVTFSWLPVLDYEQNGFVVTYTIRIIETRSGYVVQRAISSSLNSATINSLRPFTSYSCSVAASTSVGMGPFSTALTIITLQDVPEQSPTNLTATAQDSASITFSWDEPEGSHNGIIQEYRVNVTEVVTEQTFNYVTSTLHLTVNNLHPFYTYLWTVAAVTVGEGPYSSPKNVTTFEDVPSGPPTKFNGLSLNSTSIHLSWNLPAPEHQNGIITGFVVNITNLDDEVVHHFRLDSISNISVTNLLPFTTYECAIYASTVIGLGSSPAVILITTQEDAPGSHPLNSSGYAINSTHIALNWSSPQTEELNGILREYRINVTESPTQATLQYTTPSETTEIIVGSLHPYYIYHCTILAYTVEGGPSTNIISIRTHEDAPSGPPTEVVVNATSSRSISLSWSSPNPEQQNGIVRHYLITVTSSFETVTRNISSIQTRTIISGLRPYTVYSCTVQAETVATGPSSDPVQLRTPQDVPSGPPRSVIAESLNSSTLYISWSSPTSEHQNGYIQGYSISLVEIETGISMTFSTAEQNNTILNLHPYYRYSYKIAAITIGQGPFSEPFVIQLPESAPSASPDQIQITETTSTSFLVSWIDPIDQYHNGIIRSYVVIIREINTETLDVFTSYNRNQSIDSLHPYYNYTCEVAAETVSTGPYSRPVTVSTKEAVPSGPPRNLMAEVISSTVIHLSWSPPLPHEHNGVINNYTVILNQDGLSTIYTTNTTTMSAEYLLPFTTYSFRVSASTRIGSGPFSLAIYRNTLEDVPSGPPLNISFSNVTSTSFILAWQPPLTPNGVIDYYVIDLVENNTGTNFSYHARSHAFYAVGYLHPFYTYSVYISAVTVAVGPPSLELAVSTLLETPSAAPTNITAVAVDAQTFIINWAPPPIATQNGIITGYAITVSAQETGEFSRYQTTGSLSLTVENQHPDYTYSYTVAAATALGNGPFSELNSIRMPEDAPAGAPLNASASAINSTAILITWDLPSFESRNGNITGYALIVTELETNTTSIVSQNGRHIELVLGSLHPFYRYECQIAAETAAGRGPYGDAIVTRTLSDVPSGTPVNVRIVLVMSRRIDVNWDPVPSHQQNGPITHYIIMTSSQETSTTFRVNGTSTSATLTNLHPSYIYSIQVAAVTTQTGPFSEAVIATTNDDAPSGPPVEVRVSSTSSSSLVIFWQPPRQELQNGQITSYQITVTEVETGTVLSFSSDSVNISYNVGNLHPFYHYNCSVAAYTIGIGPSAHYVAQTLPDEPSLPPQNVTVIAVNATSILMTWRPPIKEGQNGFIQAYSINVTGIHTQEDFTISVNSTEATVGNLKPFLSYHFTVAAVTISRGPFSETIPVQMPTSAPESVVGNITSEILSPTSVRLSWLPGNPDTWNGIITNYTVEYSILHQVSSTEQLDSVFTTHVLHKPQSQLRNNPNPTRVTRPLTIEYIEVQELKPYFEYTFSIYFENTVGRSELSEPLYVNLPYTVPHGYPRDLSVLVLSQTAILIRWNLPDLLERNGPIVGYQIVLIYSNGSSSVYNSPHGDLLSLQIEGLTKYLNLNITVAAKTPAGVGPASPPVFVNRTHHNMIGTPIIIQAKVINKTNVDLQWTHPNNLGDIVLNYQIILYGYKKEDIIVGVHKPTNTILAVDGPITIAVEGKTTVYLIKNLMPGLYYSITVQVITAAGYRANSTEVRVNILENLVATEKIANTGAVLPIIIPVAVIGLIILIAIVLVVAVMIWRHNPFSKSSKGVILSAQNKLYSEVELAGTTTLTNYAAKDGKEYDDVNENEDDENKFTFL